MRRFCILIGLLSWLVSLPAQTGNAVSEPRDIYAHFIGTWEGASKYAEKGRMVGDTVRIVITEEPAKHRMRFDTVYIPADGPSVHRIRFVKLDPVKETMDLQEPGSDKDRFQAKGLKEFAQTGFGEFSGYHNEDPKRVQRFTIRLKADTLTYQWATSIDGGEFKPFSVFSFKRKE